MVKTVAAVVHETDAPFSIEPVELDDPRPHEVIVRMVACGLCHTDLSVRAGITPFPLPGVLGHEGAGIVEAVGAEVREVSPGDRVLLSFNSCGDCESCRTHHPATCRTWQDRNLLGGQRTDGSYTTHQGDAPINAHFFGQSSFAQHALVDETSLVKVDPSAPLEVLAPLGCGIQTGAGTVLNVLHPDADSSLAIFGAGAVGLSALMAARVSKLASVVVVDQVPARLELAKSLGADHVIDTRVDDALTAITEITEGAGADFTIEATGNTDVLGLAIKALGSPGTCAMVGAPRVGATVPIDVKFMLRGRRLVGVTQGDSDPQRFIPFLAGLHDSGQLPLERLITHYRFDEIQRAAEDAASGESIKPVLLFGD